MELRQPTPPYVGMFDMYVLFKLDLQLTDMTLKVLIQLIVVSIFTYQIILLDKTDLINVFPGKGYILIMMLLYLSYGTRYLKWAFCQLRKTSGLANGYCFHRISDNQRFLSHKFCEVVSVRSISSLRQSSLLMNHIFLGLIVFRTFCHQISYFI